MIRSDFETIQQALECLDNGDVAAARSTLQEQANDHYEIRRMAALTRLTSRHPADRRKLTETDGGTLVELFNVRGQKSRSALVTSIGEVIER